MSFTRLRCAVILAAAWIIFAMSVSAQTFVGGVRGSIKDATGAAIVGATVTLRNEAAGVTRTSTTNSSGEYVFSQVPPATYTLTAEMSGFKKLEHPGVVIGTQEFVTADMKLELGQISESVQVAGEAPLIETATASNGQV